MRALREADRRRPSEGAPARAPLPRLQAPRRTRPLGGTELRGYRLLAVVAALVAAVDQLTKTLALESLSGDGVDVLGGFVTLRITINSGGAFGVLQGVPGFFLLATIGIIVGILLWARNVEHRGWLVALGLVLGGGVGNVIDRIVRDHGGVVDFVDLHWWPVFNVADACIVTGVGLLLLLGTRSEPEDDSVKS